MPAHPHLRFEREQPVTIKRPGKPPPGIKPENIPVHARHLTHSLDNARKKAAQDAAPDDGRLLFKIQHVEEFSPEMLHKIPGVELIAQQDGCHALVFATAEALETFEARLSSLAVTGSAKYKEILYALQAFDCWTDEDRQGRALKLEGFPDTASFMLDIELWPLRSNSERSQMIECFTTWAKKQQIQILDRLNVESMVLFRVQTPLNSAKALLHWRDVRTVDLPPRHQLETSWLQTDIQHLSEISSPPNDAPIVAILDSGIASGHPLLGPAVADAQGYVPPHRLADDAAGHGTGVAGIALYGDISECVYSGAFIPRLRIVSGRILDDHAEGNRRLIENIVEEAVRELHSSYGCRVFNLSYGDERKPYLGGRVGGLAYTLDRLARELDVLFIVPTGNLRRVPTEALRSDYPDFLLHEDARLLDPAPALNALTVGSLARWDQSAAAKRWPHDPRVQPIARRDEPSPFTRSGPSVGGAIKPELVAYGGNWAMHQHHGQVEARHLGELTTHSQFATGQLLTENIGTSFAAPHVTHHAARLLSELPRDCSINLIRAILIAHAEVPPASKSLFGTRKEVQQRLLGYGAVDADGLYRSTDENISLLAEASIPNKSHHFYEIPLPNDFVYDKKRQRTITISLAHCPSVRTTRVDYKSERLEFKLVKHQSFEDVVAAYNKATEKEDYTSIAEWSRARTAGYNLKLRSRGSVQSATFTFKVWSAGRLFIVVTRNDHSWSDTTEADEPYALVVRMQDREANEARLYTQIKAILQARVRQQVRVG